MDEQPLRVFATQEAAVPLRTVYDALQKQYPAATLGVALAGDATEEELDAPDWDAAFVRWAWPERHEVLLIERDPLERDEEADNALAQAFRWSSNLPTSAGSLIVGDTLRRATTVYQVEVLPALAQDDDHAAWDALEIVLRTLATYGDGLIFAAEGFFDAEGEPLLTELEPDA